MATWGSTVFAQYGSGLSMNWHSSVLVQSLHALGYTPVLGHWSRPLVAVSLITTIGMSLPHGWNTGVLNAPQNLIISFINESYTATYDQVPDEVQLNWLWAFTVAAYLFAGMFGAFTCAYYSERFGRRNSILLMNIFVFAAAILFGCAKTANSFWMLVGARVLVGYGCGAGTGLIPMYLTEIAPINLRGSLGTLHQLLVTFGIFLSQVLGLKQTMGTEDLWPYLLAGTAVPGLLALFVMPFFPDSPRYLLINKRSEAEATRAMQIFRGEVDVHDDIQELKTECRVHEKEPEWSMVRLLFRSCHLKWPIIIVCSIGIAQQFSGINAVFFYSTSIFQAAGIPEDYVQYATVGTGVLNIVTTLFSVWAVEKYGRRWLLILGMLIMIITMAVLTLARNMSVADPANVIWPVVSLVCVFIYVVAFAAGLGPIPYFIGAEMFKQGPRPPAMALAGMLNWMCNFIVALSFPYIELELGAYSFIIFLVIASFFLALICWKLPETKNKTFDEIYKELNIQEPHEKESLDMSERKASVAVGDRLANHQDDTDTQYANIKVYKSTPEKRNTATGNQYLAVPRDPRMPPPVYLDPNEAGLEYDD